MQRKQIFLKLLAYFMYIALKHHLGVVDKRYVVTHLLNRCHVVGREEYSGAVAVQIKNLTLQLLGVDRVKSREGLVEESATGRVYDRGDELHLLGHTLGQCFNLAVAPLGKLKAFKPTEGADVRASFFDMPFSRPRYTIWSSTFIFL